MSVTPVRHFVSVPLRGYFFEMNEVRIEFDYVLSFPSPYGDIFLKLAIATIR